jgi:predicted Zn finger-like uncharacterized protein
MVVHCKHCGAASKVDDAKMPTTTFRIKCHQCQNILTVEPPKGGITPPPLRTATPIAVEPLPRPPVGRPITATGSLRSTAPRGKSRRHRRDCRGRA